MVSAELDNMDRAQQLSQCDLDNMDRAQHMVAGDLDNMDRARQMLLDLDNMDRAQQMLLDLDNLDRAQQMLLDLDNMDSARQMLLDLDNMDRAQQTLLDLDNLDRAQQRLLDLDNMDRAQQMWLDLARAFQHLHQCLSWWGQGQSSFERNRGRGDLDNMIQMRTAVLIQMMQMRTSGLHNMILNRCRSQNSLRTWLDLDYAHQASQVRQTKPGLCHSQPPRQPQAGPLQKQQAHLNLFLNLCLNLMIVRTTSKPKEPTQTLVH